MALLPPYRLSGSFSLWVPSQEVGPTRGSQVVWSLLRARLSVTLPPLLPEEAGEQVAHSLTWRNPTWCWLSTIGGAAPRGWPVSPSLSPGVFRRCHLVQGDPLPSAGKCWEASAAASGSLSTSARVAGVAPIRQCPCLEGTKTAPVRGCGVPRGQGPVRAPRMYSCSYFSTLFFLNFFLAVLRRMEFLSRELDRSRSVAVLDPLTHFAGPGVEPASWCCRGTADRLAPKWELQYFGLFSSGS